MKQLILVLLSALMLSPAMAFDQTDLDNLESFDQLIDRDDVNMEGITARRGGDSINNFLGGRNFTCVASNRRGARYRAQGKVLRNVQRRVMRQCRRDSRRPSSCRIDRCTRRGGKLGQFIDLVDTLDDLFD